MGCSINKQCPQQNNHHFSYTSFAETLPNSFKIIQAKNSLHHLHHSFHLCSIFTDDFTILCSLFKVSTKCDSTMACFIFSVLNCNLQFLYRNLDFLLVLYDEHGFGLDYCFYVVFCKLLDI